MIFIKYSNVCLKSLIIIINLCALILILIDFKRRILFSNNTTNRKLINYSNFSYEFSNELFFNLSSIKYYFSYKFNRIELEYNFQFFDKENNLIIPSDLSLYYNLHAFCIINYGNNSLQSISNILQNKYFSCVEYYELNFSAKFEIKICNDSSECKSFEIFDTNFFNFNDIKNLKDDKFDFNYINKQYILLLKNIRKSKNDFYLLKRCYISEPIYSTKDKVAYLNNIWFIKNIYNHYFCFCKGFDCKNDQRLDICKYYLYISFIDENKYLYEKNYYLLADFLIKKISPGDAYFVFLEMIKQNMSAFYLTERKDIYKKHYDKNVRFQRIIPIINKQNKINGNILEKYLDFFLRLKSVISGAEFYSKENLFYKIDYITFICLGHGVNYFKPFLYKEYYGCNRYNKILLSSEKTISLAKLYGWQEKNIIKIGLPKWDLFNIYSHNMKHNQKEKCIFMMFTWRNLRKRKKISPKYFNNILKILYNLKLNRLLSSKNITLYFSLHHNLLNKRKLIKEKKNIKYINQEDILACLIKCDLVISDFSSIIFDYMYRKKPIIIFIPDSEDKSLNKLYDEDYFNIINGLKNNSIEFENKFFKVSDTINKIEYYILNDFHLEAELKSLYEQFNLTGKNNINRFIEYVKGLSKNSSNGY